MAQRMTRGRRRSALKDGSSVVIAIAPGENGANWLEAEAMMDGRLIGGLTFNVHYQSVDEVWVAVDKQRVGVATAMYDLLEAMGHRPEPSGDLTEDGRAFWSARLARSAAPAEEAVEELAALGPRR